MKELTQDEFEDRAMALQRARRIFIETGLTNNLTHAFEAYQAIFAEREREIFIITQQYGNKSRTFMDKYDRPKCVECGADMAFRQVPENREGVKVQLVCMNDKCDTVLNSENDITWWMQHLKIKEGEISDGSVTTFKGVDEIQENGRHTGDSRRVSG